MGTVLITGVTSGTGLGITKALLGAGYKVFGSLRNKEKALLLQEELGENFTPLIFDICEPEQVDEAASELKNLLGNDHLSALINNAGSAEIGPLLHLSREDFSKQLDVLVGGQLYVIQKLYTYLIPTSLHQKPGRILNISSVSGKNSNYFFGGYCAGKHALEGLSKTLRLELSLYGIDVIVIAPGNIATSIWKKQTPEIILKYKSTAYYQGLKNAIDKVNSGSINNIMTVDEFSEAFLKIFMEEKPACRYTVVKTRNRMNPFSKQKLTIMKK